MLIISSVFLILILFSGAVSAHEDNFNQTLSQNVDEVVRGDTGEILTVEGSSAGITDDSGLKELDNESKNIRPILKSTNNQLLSAGATINVDGNTFADIQAAIDGASEGDTLYLNSPLYTGSGTQINVNKNLLTIIGCEGCTLDAQQQSRILYLNGNNLTIQNIKVINSLKSIEIFQSVNVTFSNCSFINNMGESGACIYIQYNCENVTITDCTFINNTASKSGGAFYCSSSNNINILGSTFINNSANWDGGAVAIYSAMCHFSDCIFINNSAIDYGGAISSRNKNFSIFNSILINNKVKSNSLTSINNNLQLTFTFKGKENYINAIYTLDDEPVFNNVTYWNGAVVNSDNVYPVRSDYEAGIDITVEVYDSNGDLVDNYTNMTDANGQMFYDYSKLNNQRYTYKAYHPDDKYYTYIERTGNFMGPKKYNIIVLNNQTYYTKENTPTKINATIKDNTTGNNIRPTNSKLLFII